MSQCSTRSNLSVQRSSQNLHKEVVEPFALIDILDTPLGIAKFEHSSLKSFNAAVRDLIQQNPDTPVGGMPAITPLEKAKDTLEPLARSLGMGKELLSQASITRSQSWCSSTSVLMVTAPETPHTEDESDKHAITTFTCQDIERNTPDALRYLHDPDFQASTTTKLCQVSNFDGASPLACCELMEDDRSVPSVNTGQYCPGSDLCPENPMNSCTISMPTPNFPGGPTLESSGSGVGIPRTLRNVEEHVSTLSNTLNLPVDGTGILSAPPTPKPRRRTCGKDKFLKSVRKTRAACCKRPIMSVVIGRQLASPVSSALRAIAKEEVPDFTEFLPVAPSEIKAPVPLPA